jgi:uncharacterized protein YuzE
MKTGDRVEVIELYKLDEKSSVKVGDTGEVKSITCVSETNIINVAFDKGEIVPDYGIVINEVGTYPLYEDQLELIKL